MALASSPWISVAAAGATDPWRLALSKDDVFAAEAQLLDHLQPALFYLFSGRLRFEVASSIPVCFLIVIVLVLKTWLKRRSWMRA